MNCPKCGSEYLIETEYGNSSSDVTDIGMECEECGYEIDPSQVDDLIFSSIEDSWREL